MGISAENRNLMSKLMKSYKEIDKNMQNGICCWGAGSNGRWCLDYLLENNYKVDYFIDSSPALQNKKINNIPIVKRDRPKMALSVYHRPDDLFRIIGLVGNLNIPYNYALRHHSHLLIDTVLYCWI